MNRLRAYKSVPFAQRDVAPVGGTAEYAHNLQTRWSAYHYNMVQEELMAVVEGAGLTPDDTNWAQFIQGIGLFSQTGQCRLAGVSATQIILNRYDGSRLRINGVGQTIPAVGVSLTNTGLAASTLYYIYAFMSGSTMTLEASTTGHVTSTVDGTEIKSGDATRALVGAVYTTAATPGQFQDGVTARGIASWYNRKRKQLESNNTSGASTAANVTYAELSSGSRVLVVGWFPEDMVEASVRGSVSTSIAGGSALTGISFAAAQPSTAAQVFSTNAGQNVGCNAWLDVSPNIAGVATFLTIMGLTTGGGTSTWNASIRGWIRN